MSHQTNFAKAGLVACVVATATACSDSGPTAMSRAAGIYEANESVGTFTLAESPLAAPIDLLATGLTVEITLGEDGTTSGRFFVPGGEEDGSDFDIDLEGSWTLEGDFLRLFHAPDNVLGEVTFQVETNAIAARSTFSGETLDIRLVRLTPSAAN